ncbi:hypothetical protein T4D_12676 [Trichinella pseudospiralis]|uniref:Uncharacterized protein n=1 Tax=Trichinella pseudospiralis TaxID=6337 RepID=A0A0V1F675_TRIPS|nr:hypothetical protein T4D_12676 [Trichinella pseudospiralis]
MDLHNRCSVIGVELREIVQYVIYAIDSVCNGGFFAFNEKKHRELLFELVKCFCGLKIGVYIMF